VITKEYPWREMLEVMREITDTSVDLGTPIFFDIVAIPDAPFGSASLEFRTYERSRGLDRTISRGVDLLTFSIDNDNVISLNQSYDYLDEINFVYALGQGDEGERPVETAEDIFRVEQSPLNRREGVIDAKSIDTLPALEDEAKAEVTAGQPVRRFRMKVKESQAFRFMRDWFLGDKVNAIGAQETLYECFIDAVTFQIDPERFDVSAILKVEDFIP